MVPLVLVLLLFGVLVVVKKRACSELAPRFRPHLVLKYFLSPFIQCGLPLQFLHIAFLGRLSSKVLKLLDTEVLFS